MAIMETALERAKQQRAQQPPVAASPPQAGPLAAPRRRSEDIEALPAPVKLEFPRLEVNRDAVVQHRILLAPERDLSGIVDAYRILRTRLLSRMQLHGWNSLAVTSAGPGEGKSVTALNLSLAIATERKRNVFLLDLDLRKPSLARYLGVPPRASVGEFLSGEAKLEDIFFTVTDNLIVASSFQPYHHSADLLGSQRMGELLAHVRKLDPNALIIADLPPLLSVADALVVAPKLSATLLVVAEGATSREGLARAKEVLGGVTVAGIVLNHATSAVHNYYG